MLTSRGSYFNLNKVNLLVLCAKDNILPIVPSFLTRSCDYALVYDDTASSENYKIPNYNCTTLRNIKIFFTIPTASITLFKQCLFNLEIPNT